MNYNNIPQELKPLKRWLCYKLEPKKDRDGSIKTDAAGNTLYSKPPKRARDGYGASKTNPDDWATFAEAEAAIKRLKLDGLGFTLQGLKDYFVVDLDHVINEAGQITPEAAEIVRTLDSYTEYSPSRRGLHIICRGSLPPGVKKSSAPWVEFFYNTGYVTMTGEPFGGLRPIAERTQEGGKLHARYVTASAPKEAPQAAQTAQESDAELLEKAFNSNRGAEFRRLWAGDLSSYNNDHSAADLALASDLAYWTNGDRARMDALFRQSGLYREKWDRRDGTYGTYGNRTIEKALEGFTPWEPVRGSAADFDDLDAPASSPVGSQPPAAPPRDPLEGLTPAAEYLRKQFRADREQFQGYKQRKTGFADIDATTGGLYPGLYVLGALSSLGKTTFAHQLADQLAKAGDTVLFFSLEQSVFELTTKSLARESYKLARDKRDLAGALSSIELRAGRTSPLMKMAYANYMEYADRVIVKECNFNETAESIAETVKAFIAKTGITPVVMVDYLQIIPAENPRMSDKEKTDQNMRRLKIMQREHDLVVFVISALNRANYLTTISFESFRESSGIEYTADVVWGMQYAILSTDPVFSDPQKKIGEKRRKIQQAKAETPRDIELVCLKNRYGRDFSTTFSYYPKYDFFDPSCFPPEPGEFGSEERLDLEPEQTTGKGRKKAGLDDFLAM